jgi:LmbE family N-acetylglucosaminyl deacetylase
MKPVVVAVFAHPDDEAFGPGGTLAVLSKTHDVYIVTVTGGEAGKDSLHSKNSDLADIRKKELLASAKVLGVKKVFFLGFEDGTLSNNLYHTIGKEIEKKIKKLNPATVITFEQGGVSGHIDHIAVHFITTYVVKNLKDKTELWYYFVPDTHSSLTPDYFIHYPTPQKAKAAHKVISTHEVWETKKKAMLMHKSQAHDAKRIITHTQDLPKKEYFFIFKG